MASNRIVYNATMKAIAYVSEQIARQNCCDHTIVCATSSAM
jgi:hypothetical protein